MRFERRGEVLGGGDRFKKAKGNVVEAKWSDEMKKGETF